MDMNEVFKQRAELNEKIMKMNIQQATLETDLSNPTVFNIPQMKENWKSQADPDSKRWRCVYATYFDKNLSIKEGRRVPKELCLEKPNINLISIAVEDLGFKMHLDPIAKHPRDFFGLGRLKIKMVDEDGVPVNKEIGTSKRKLFAKIAENFPKAQERFDETLAQQKKEAEAQQAEIRKL